ncbi:Hsp20/alpha crystallin family protein [Patescibacteria group bacterium]|nr:Hsp20/alpha crystallin family protein [Patescibacteria group bacterium]
MSQINISSHSLSDPEPGINLETDDFYDTPGEMELPVDIARHGDHLIIVAPIVGVKNEQIDLTVNNDILYIHKIASDPPIDKVDNYYVQECHWGTLSREIQLPVAVDPVGAKASLQDGVLKIILPILGNRKSRIIKVR